MKELFLSDGTPIEIGMEVTKVENVPDGCWGFYVTRGRVQRVDEDGFVQVELLEVTQGGHNTKYAERAAARGEYVFVKTKHLKSITPLSNINEEEFFEFLEM